MGWGFWEASGTYPAKPDLSTPPPPGGGQAQNIVEDNDEDEGGKGVTMTLEYPCWDLEELWFSVRRYTVASLFMWSGLIASTIRFGYALEWEDVENSLSAYWVERLPLFICNICWVWYSTGAQTAGHVVPSRPGSFCSGGDDSGQHRH